MIPACYSRLFFYMEVSMSFNAVTEKAQSALVLKKAVTEEEMESVLRLRFEVFNLELDEGLASSFATGMDRDVYDRHCDHIMVVDPSRDLVVGTYRMMTGKRADAGVGFYSENEFDLRNIFRQKGEKLELGRACVHKDYRGSAVLNLMWSGVARYILEHDIKYVFGCGSIHTINPKIISNAYAYLKNSYLADPEFRAYPLACVPGFDANSDIDRGTVLEHIPPLLLAYLKLGARICGEPAFDGGFGVSDFLILLDRERLINRYRNRYF
jgi:L-ornithine Nalpha-acyltransferase